MSKSRVALPDDLVRVLEIIRTGKLFALQERIRAGARIHFPEITDYKFQPLDAAVGTGFHSIIEELLKAGGWNAIELTTALETSISIGRPDIADLLLAHGAPIQNVDFQLVCDTMDLSLMEKFLRAGGDPSCNNGFAYALSTKKARPLLRFYRQFRPEFSKLDDQAALALMKAVENNNIGWMCLPIWAGADPFRPVPYDLDGSFPVTPDDSTTVAARMMWKDNPAMVKAMKLNPNATQARELLDCGYRPNLELIQKLLKFIPPSEINGTDRKSCLALENFVRHGSYAGYWTKTGEEPWTANAIKAIELLLDHGARWNPAPTEIRYTRRGLLARRF